MATATQTFKNFIDGESVDAAEGHTDAVLNPATGEEIAQAASSTQEDVERAVKAARTAFESGWGTTTPGERALAILKLADALEERADEIAELESANAGKPIEAFKGDEVPAMVDNLRFFAGAARCMEGKAAGEYLEGYTSMIRREPVGVIGQIAPWNYPIMMAVWKIGPALATGNTIVLKPAPTTPLSTHPPRGDRLGVPAQGRAQRHRRRQRPGRGARRARRRRHGLAHRLGRDRQVDRRARGQDAQEGPPRAGRQGAGRGLRRRRPRLRARDDRRHRLLQRRPGLHRGDARAGLERDPRRRRQRPGQGGRRLRHGRHELGRHDARPGELRPPARARRGLPRAHALARRDRHRRQGARPARLLPAADGRVRAASRTTR